MSKSIEQESNNHILESNPGSNSQWIALPTELPALSPVFQATDHVENNLDLAIDVLAALLKDFGQNAFDLPTLAAESLATRCDTWARHVLFATAPPDNTAVGDALVGGKRDWNALRAFFHQHRRNEKEYVQTALNDLRSVIWTCIQELDQTFRGETHSDEHLRLQMERLQSVTQCNDLEEIKLAVLSTVSTINQRMEQQRQQQKLRMEGLHARIRELDYLLAQARKENCIDSLTNLFNRKAFSEQITHTMNLVNLFDESACLFLVDADHFKSINDTYGHPAGDTTLRALADCLSRHFSGRNDCVARYGGEEFVILCQEMDLNAGRRQAERLLETVRAMTIRHPGLNTEIHLSVSIGLAKASASDNVTTWIDRADKALYRAKQGGRDRLEIN